MSAGVIRPGRLKTGDTVRVVAPSGPPTREKTAAGIALLESWGLDVQISERVYDRMGYLAGDDEARAGELNDALRDRQVRAVICARGGYGVTRMVESIDFDAARADPKPVAGYSDITALHHALYVRSGVAGVHGPVLTTFAANHDEGTAQSFRSALMSDEPVVVEASVGEATAELSTGDAPVSGRLLGGNLSLVASAVGTANCPQYGDSILFLEEINEAPYRVDGMLTQLRRSGVLEGIVGVALGQFTSCEDSDWNWNVIDVLRDRLTDLNVPILGGLPLGHGADPRTVPYGTVAVLDPVGRTLTVEAAVR